ncbi:MAG TPA: hypothetical protein VFL89_04155 [Solirubrobacterales bacterium]|nr:hypothetical protein [Solirubrobacterales bacterium]
MRKKLIVVLALGATLALAFAAVSAAKWSIFQAGNLVLKADGGVSPKALPKKSYAPVTVNVKGEVSDKTGGHPAAIREALIDFDKNGKIDTTGLPVCKGSQLEARDTNSAKRVCGKTIVGKGSGKIEIAFQEQSPIAVNAPITVFNGGTKGGKTTLYIHTFITVPVPSAVVTTVTIKKVHKGRYGLSTVSKIPVIAGGSGSVLSFNIEFGKKYTYKGKKRSYIEARCTDGHFNAKVIKAIFKDEDRTAPENGTTTLSGTVIRPCTPKG